MVRKITLFLFSFFLLVSCAPASKVSTAPVVINVNSTSAAQPWLSELFNCADKNSLTLNVTSENSEIVLQIGEPKDLLTPAFKIDEEELLVVTHRESSLQNMNLEEVQALFAGQGDPSMQVWVYAPDEDVQVLFEQVVMNGRSVSSLAKLAVSTQQMSDQLNADSHSVGILPRHWKTGNTRDIYSIGTYPVLAITRSIPQGAVQTLITCLQRN